MIGALNPLPFRVGGGPTRSSKLYGIMRRAVGEGGSAEDESGIDGTWRRSRAKGLASAFSSKRRALLQFWPHLARDAVPYYERVLGITPPEGASLVARREAVVAEWTAQLDASTPAVRQQLQLLDARFDLLEVPDAQSRRTQFGRGFGPLDPSLEGEFGLDGYSIAPNYSTDFIVVVQFATGYHGALTPGDGRLRERAIELLRRTLPSWVSFRICTHASFILDLSCLDLEAFGS